MDGFGGIFVFGVVVLCKHGFLSLCKHFVQCIAVVVILSSKGYQDPQGRNFQTNEISLNHMEYVKQRRSKFAQSLLVPRLKQALEKSRTR